ncbi:hypothetical protein [Beggiatoa leptomitoformis]|uniref:Uncharacterized protein n=1 Tax=Beggiatoa leptomitoformis TaxID=288004 RepID=A0A2N9YB82_9GAMM|nr:hypothetical protein [Beggiatoa leptomitoformis]ALG66912.1 hypothetical protein AL038_03260 [Beggiatoa leptomitoformis]AUI67723.1 hypothetical protein BLE401_02770 [Beggiatoa leptomitoformis]
MHYTIIRFIKNVLILLFLVSYAAIAEQTKTTFKTDKPYANNKNLRETLVIPNAEALEVTVKGMTEEKYDYLLIVDNAGNEQRFTGAFDTRFSVLGSSIRVQFRSDPATVADGVTVSIAPISLFKKIKFQLLAATEVILREGTAGLNERFTKITQNLSHLREQIGQIQDLDSVATPVKEQLVLIAQTYHDAANSGGEIIKKHQQQFELLRQLQKITNDNIENILKKQRENQDQVTNFQSLLSKITDPLEQQKVQISLEGTRNILSTLEAQRIIWTDFQQVENELIRLLQAHSKLIEVLLYSMNISAQVYDQAVNVVSLQSSKLLSLERLNNLSELQKIVSEIQNSEAAIMQITKRIEQTDANF